MTTSSGWRRAPEVIAAIVDTRLGPGDAVLLGIVVGLVLRFTALLTLRRVAPVMPAIGLAVGGEPSTYSANGSSESDTR